MRNKNLLTSVTSLRFLALAVALVVTAITLFSGHSSAQSKCSATGNESVSVDKTHYALGDTVRVSGSGFAPACALEVQVTAPDLSRSKDSVTTNSDGQFDYSYVVAGPAGRWYNVDVLGQDGPLGGNLFSAGPIVWTDQGDYLPGDKVTISGQGWKAGETVRLVIHDTSAQRMDRVVLAKADAEGAFENTDFTPEAQHLGVAFKLTASGLTSGYLAENNFMDGPKYVQTVGTTTASGFNSSMAVTVPAAGIAAGDSVIVGLQVGSNSSPSEVSCSDPVNLSYQKDVWVGGGGNAFVIILSKHNVQPVAAGQKITCTYTTHGNGSSMSVNEFAGLAAAPLDKTSASAQSNTGAQSSKLTATTTQADELVFGMSVSNGFTVATSNAVEGTYMPPYTLKGQVAQMYPFYRIPTTPALRQYELNGTVGGSGYNFQLVATYKVAAASSATLTVKTVVNNNHNGTKKESDFKVHVKNAGADVTDSPAAGSSAGKAYTLAAGSYEVSAEAVTGYTTSFSGDCDSLGNVTLAAGTSKVCTITSSDVAPTLKVNKFVVPDTDSGLFNILIDGAQKAANVGKNGSTGAVEVDAGTRTVSETAGTNTTLSDYVTVFGGDCAADGSVTLELGDKKTCTSTSTRLSHLVVKNVTQPASDSTSFGFTVSGGPTPVPGFSLGNGQQKDNPVQAGTYAVAQTPVNGYDTTSSCGPTVTLTPGQTVTCTFTTIKRGQVVLKKVTNPAGDPTDFNLTLSGGPSKLNEGYQVKGGGSVTSGYVVPGQGYSVSENVLPGWLLASVVCDAGNAANFSIAPGEVVTCTFTNLKDTDKDNIPDNVDCNPNIADDSVVDPNGVVPASFTGGRFKTLQEAVTAALDNHMISMYADTKENVVIGASTNSGGKDLRICGCGHKVTAVVKTSPVIKVESSAGSQDADSGKGEKDIHIDDVDVLGAATVGYHVMTSKVGATGTSTLLKGIRSTGHGVGVKIEGSGNQVRGANALDSNTSFGLQVVGDNNLLQSNRVSLNGGNGIDIAGKNNEVDGNKVGDKGTGNTGHGVAVHANGATASTGNSIHDNDVFANKKDGINVVGNSTTLLKNSVGDASKGNTGDGIKVEGTGNTIQENDVFASGGDGIEVNGGTAASPNVVVKNDVGDKGKGNLGNGILVAGIGSGTTNPVEIEENTVKGNKLVGISVTGSGHQLKNNVSGGSGTYASGGEKNGTYAYSVAAGNFNATGNKANGTTVAGAANSAFPTGNTGQ